MNKASQNAFVKLNKAVEVSNGVEIITVAMAGAGAGAQHHQLSKLTIEMLGVKYVPIPSSGHDIPPARSVGLKLPQITIRVKMLLAELVS